MKKILTLMALLFTSAMLSFTFTSCGDDDKEEDSPLPASQLASVIVGTWQFDYFGTQTVCIKSNGTGWIMYSDDDLGQQYPLTWRCSGNTLFITYDEDEQKMVATEVAQNQITFKVYYFEGDADIDEADGRDDFGYYDIITATRIQ